MDFARPRVESLEGRELLASIEFSPGFSLKASVFNYERGEAEVKYLDLANSGTHSVTASADAVSKEITYTNRGSLVEIGMTSTISGTIYATHLGAVGHQHFDGGDPWLSTRPAIFTIVADDSDREGDPVTVTIEGLHYRTNPLLSNTSQSVGLYDGDGAVLYLGGNTLPGEVFTYSVGAHVGDQLQIRLYSSISVPSSSFFSLTGSNSFDVRLSLSTGADLQPTSLAWNTAEGGVDYSYAISSVLPEDTTATFYWSTDQSFDRGQDTPIVSTPLKKGQSGNTSSRLPASSITVAPPPGTNYLLLVTDPDDRFKGEASEENNVVSVAYEPTIEFVGAKYDGDKSPEIIGRFFANPTTGPPPITDQTLTLRLSDSLAALLPTLTVGGHSTERKPDGRTYETEGFDPGELADMSFLVSRAVMDEQVLAEEDSPRFRVLPLPDWFPALAGETIEFNSGAGGGYTLEGHIARLGSPTLFVVPGDVPIIGGRPLGATIGYGVSVATPLDEQVPATAGAFAGMSLNLLDLASAEYNLSTSAEVVEGLSIELTLQSILDPSTLEMRDGFGVTILVSASENLGEKTFYENVGVVGIFLVDYGIKGAIDLKLNAQVQVTLVDDALRVVGNGGTYIDFGPTGSLTGFADIGWFIPPKFTDPLVTVLRRRLPGYFPASGNLLPALRLKNELTGSLDIRGRVDYSGAAEGPDATFDTSLESSINVQVKQTLEFLIGNVNLLGILPPFTVQLFPKTLPYKFKMFS
ncbi:hypothetical protein AB1L88_15450 [Tautonia sp. JC769]|uniref:hypothetical protein n=1 Tax=Tautonia sp. JC769 TaxID=3232135 RepID=UPI003459801D